MKPQNFLMFKLVTVMEGSVTYMAEIKDVKIKHLVNNSHNSCVFVYSIKMYSQVVLNNKWLMLLDLAGSSVLKISNADFNCYFLSLVTGFCLIFPRHS